MKYSSLFILILILVSSCSSTGSTEKTHSSTTEQPEKTVPDLTGQWYIENIVFNDSNNVRPSEEVPESNPYITFDNERYSIMTNCNSISGTYDQKEDTIRFGDGAMTEMACENMATEDALRKILPEIILIDVENDSIVRLNCSDSSSYIILRKAPIQVKCHVE